MSEGKTARQTFAADIMAVAVAFGQKERIDAARITLYWEGLRDIPQQILHAGAKRCIQACDHFPSVAEWRRACDEANRELLFAEPLPPERQLTGNVADSQPEWDDHSPHYYHCDACRDTGFEPHICRAGQRCGCAVRSCRDRDDHYEHRYVRKCECRETNPALMRLREENARKRAGEGRYALSLPRAREGY